MLDVSEIKNCLLPISVKCELEDIKRRNGNEWKQIRVNQTAVHLDSTLEGRYVLIA